MSDTILPKTQQEEASMELRNLVVAGISDPKVKDDFAPYVDMFKLQQYFGFDYDKGNIPSYKQQQIINGIYEFFDKRKLSSMNQVYKEINLIERKIGLVPLGQTRLNHLWNYIKVLGQLGEYEELRKSYEK